MITVFLKTAMRSLATGMCLLLVVAFMHSSVATQERQDAPLTNATVVKLVKAGFKEKTIIAIINSRPNHFNLETEQLIQLKRSGVSENIILSMLSLSEWIGNEDGWNDEPIFRSPGKLGDSEQNNQQGSGVDIFGSSSGSRSQTRSRSGNGGNENDRNLTGSATVRIIRPPTEAGGVGAAKLERTPTLNNEAVIRLVEAGFSEGTIIKRIEDSPVDFDLSAAKLEELHKRRVTDPIIAAMNAAMSDGPKANAPQPEREN